MAPRIHDEQNPQDADLAAPGADPTTQRLFNVRLVPHRSLTSANFRVLIALFSLICVMTSVPFVIIGAWPVALFMGLDIAIVYLAFRANFHAARAYEDILLTPLELLLAKVSPAGCRAEFRFNPAWVRLDKVSHAEFGVQRLAFASRGANVEVASFLGPEAKAKLAGDLTTALRRAKRGPDFS